MRNYWLGARGHLKFARPVCFAKIQKVREKKVRIMIIFVLRIFSHQAKCWTAWSCTQCWRWSWIPSWSWTWSCHRPLHLSPLGRCNSCRFSQVSKSSVIERWPPSYPQKLTSLNFDWDGHWNMHETRYNQDRSHQWSSRPIHNFVSFALKSLGGRTDHYRPFVRRPSGSTRQESSMILQANPESDLNGRFVLFRLIWNVWTDGRHLYKQDVTVVGHDGSRINDQTEVLDGISL